MDAYEKWYLVERRAIFALCVRYGSKPQCSSLQRGFLPAALFGGRARRGPTPERLIAYVQSHPLEGQSADERSKRLEKVADQVNGLSYEQRRHVRAGRQLESFFRSLTSAEQTRFLDRTLPTGFKQMMEAFNKMTPAKRKEFVERTLADMRKQEDGDAPPPDDENVEKIINEGLKSFYTEASAEVKMDFAPLIEQDAKEFAVAMTLALRRRTRTPNETQELGLVDSAFTLAELLVVIAVIATLAALVIPVYQRVTQSGHVTTCVGHLRQIGIALNGYLADHNMTMPTLKAGREKLTDAVAVLDNTLDQYLTDRRVFACPADPHWAEVSGTSYHWNVALNGQSAVNLNFLKFITNPSRIPVVGDKEGFHPYLDTKVNILYADGHTSKEVSFVTGN
jgi:prepilin-type N-terminal cleavage/methylation domain-containing protein/prepilin-type processing-associated H-X9-DG protein